MTLSVGIDMANNVLQMHGEGRHGKTVLKKQRQRDRMAIFFALIVGAISPHAWGAGSFDSLVNDLKNRAGESLQKSLSDAMRTTNGYANGSAANGSPTAAPNDSGGSAPVAALVAGRNAAQPALTSGLGGASCVAKRTVGAQSRLPQDQQFKPSNGFVRMTVLNHCTETITVLTFQNYQSRELCIPNQVRPDGFTMSPVVAICRTAIKGQEATHFTVPCTCPAGTGVNFASMPQE